MTSRRSTDFFFSSRRRHTRFDCDWSSDVCSSDLRPGLGRLVAGALGGGIVAPLRPARVLLRAGTRRRTRPVLAAGLAGAGLVRLGLVRPLVLGVRDRKSDV